MFAAMTRPPARMQTPRVEGLRAKYSPDEAALFLIYSRGRHAGERGYPELQYASSDAEKAALARMLAARTSLPIAVDDIEETTLRRYGAVPNACYVINREGTIVFRATWADSRKVEQALDALLAAESAARRAGVLAEQQQDRGRREPDAPREGVPLEALRSPRREPPPASRDSCEGKTAP